MSCGRSCAGGVHVFRMAYVTICCVLLENISYWMTFYYLMGYVFRRACLAVGDVLRAYMFYRWMRTGFTGGYVL